MLVIVLGEHSEHLIGMCAYLIVVFVSVDHGGEKIKSSEELTAVAEAVWGSLDEPRVADSQAASKLPQSIGWI